MGKFQTRRRISKLLPASIVRVLQDTDSSACLQNERANFAALRYAESRSLRQIKEPNKLVDYRCCVLYNEYMNKRKFPKMPTRKDLIQLRELIDSFHLPRKLKRLKRALERYQHDPLTGLLDREGLEERVEKWGRLHQPVDQFAMAFVDLNNFKKVNDNYGHNRGDEALKLVAGLLTSSFRRDDELVARVGGDEFALFLPFSHGSALGHRRGKQRHYEALSQYLISVMEDELRRHIESSPEEYAYMNEIGFAVGVRVYSQKDVKKGINELLNEPDKDMYRVKQVQKRPTR